jgi:hypothetical protein
MNRPPRRPQPLAEACRDLTHAHAARTTTAADDTDTTALRVPRTAGLDRKVGRVQKTALAQIPLWLTFDGDCTLASTADGQNGRSISRSSGSRATTPRCPTEAAIYGKPA